MVERRKGSKCLKPRDLSVIGSGVDYMAYDPVCPFLVVRTHEKRAEKEGGAFRFGVCLDGSENALNALNSLTKFIDPEKDFVDMINVEKMSIKSETIKEEGEKRCSDLGFKNTSFTVLPFNPD